LKIFKNYHFKKLFEAAKSYDQSAVAELVVFSELCGIPIHGYGEPQNFILWSQTNPTESQQLQKKYEASIVEAVSGGGSVKAFSSFALGTANVISSLIDAGAKAYGNKFKKLFAKRMDAYPQYRLLNQYIPELSSNLLLPQSKPKIKEIPVSEAKNDGGDEQVLARSAGLRK